MPSMLIRRRLESTHPDLPELLPFVGKEVEISVREAPDTAPAPGSGARWRALDAIAGRGMIDGEALRELDEADLRSRAEAAGDSG